MDEDLEEHIEQERGKIIQKVIAKLSFCPYCPAKFSGTFAKMEEDRINHIKDKHPEKRPFKIGD